MTTNSILVIVAAIGTFIVTLAATLGLVYIASIDKTQTQPVVTILSAILTGFVTAGAAVVTHYLGGVQEQQRIVLSESVKTNAP